MENEVKNTNMESTVNQLVNLSVSNESLRNQLTELKSRNLYLEQILYKKEDDIDDLKRKVEDEKVGTIQVEVISRHAPSFGCRTKYYSPNVEEIAKGIKIDVNSILEQEYNNLQAELKNTKLDLEKVVTLRDEEIQKKALEEKRMRISHFNMLEEENIERIERMNAKLKNRDEVINSLKEKIETLNTDIKDLKDRNTKEDIEEARNHQIAMLETELELTKKENEELLSLNVFKRFWRKLTINSTVQKATEKVNLIRRIYESINEYLYRLKRRNNISSWTDSYIYGLYDLKF